MEQTKTVEQLGAAQPGRWIMPRTLWVIPLLLGVVLAPPVVTFRDMAGRLTPVIVSGGPKENYVLEVLYQPFGGGDCNDRMLPRTGSAVAPSSIAEL